MGTAGEKMTKLLQRIQTNLPTWHLELEWFYGKWRQHWVIVGEKPVGFSTQFDIKHH
jgi:hypothetical protein